MLWLLRRLSHYRAVLRPGWRYLFAVPFAVWTVFAAWREEFLSPEAAAKLKLLTIIHNYAPFIEYTQWHWGLIATLVILLVVALEGSYRLARVNQVALELIFDGKDPKCVRDEYYILLSDKPPKKRHWSIGVRNSSSNKSIDDVTVIAEFSWFIHNTIPTQNNKSPIIFSVKTLEPKAIEYAKLLSLEAYPKNTSGDVFKRRHEFVLEARARDVETVRLTLIYEPTEPFATIKRRC